MKSLLFSIALCAFRAGAQSSEPVYQLVSVTWSLHDHKLRWDIAQGHEDDKGDFVMEKLLEQCEIDPDKGTMTIAGETRGFSKEETISLHRLLDVLANYAAESFVWWQRGGGTPEPDGKTVVASHKIKHRIPVKVAGAGK